MFGSETRENCFRIYTYIIYSWKNRSNFIEKICLKLFIVWILQIPLRDVVGLLLNSYRETGTEILVNKYEKI